MDSQQAKIPETMDTSGTKRQHLSNTSDSDKDNP